MEQTVASPHPRSPKPAADREVMVGDGGGLRLFLGQIEPHRDIAVDTEADSLHSYFEKLCLIQISVPGLHALVDSLGGFDLTPLLRLMEQRRVVFHGADFDLRMLQRAGDFHPPNVFDTMIAARLVGHREFSLAALVKEYFDIVLSKGSQKANWAMRPLSPAMVAYAHNDTRYLLELAARLERRLMELGRLEWFRQSCERMVQQVFAPPKAESKERWKIKGWTSLKGRAVVVLRELWQWREMEAQQADRPPFHILRNEDLIKAAQMFVAGLQPSFAHLSSGKRKRLQAAGEAALVMDESLWPKPESHRGRRMTVEEERQVEQMKAMRDQRAEELNLDASLIAPRATLERLAVSPQQAGELLLPWQRFVLGV